MSNPAAVLLDIIATGERVRLLYADGAVLPYGLEITRAQYPAPSTVWLTTDDEAIATLQRRIRKLVVTAVKTHKAPVPA